MEIGEGYLPLGGEAAACWYCGVAVAGRVQVSPPVAALSPGGGGFDPGGAHRFCVEEMRATHVKHRVSFWAWYWARPYPNRVTDVSHRIPSFFSFFLIENQGILGDTRILPYPAVSERQIGNSCRVHAF